MVEAENIGRTYKEQALRQNLHKIQKYLPAYQRPFSKFVHNSAVEKVSETSAKTIARPSGIFVGGTFSFLTSIGILLICRYFGYEYNYLIGLLSFSAGFIAGILIEALGKILNRSPA